MKQIRTADRLDATVSIPGSKSVTHRYLVMAALAQGRSQLQNALWCADTRYTATALERMGAQIIHSSDAVEVVGTGGTLRSPSAPVFLENAGTSMRLLTAVACLSQGTCVLTGDERMHSRPIGELLNGLRPLGGMVESLEQEGYPPVKVDGGGLKGGRTEVDASRSSQFVSAILLAAPYAAQSVEVIVQGLVSRPYVDITLEGMSSFGVKADWVDAKTLRVGAPGSYLSGTYRVEGDSSSASYFWAAAAITGGKVTTLNLRRTSSQGDLALLQLLERMGCRVHWADNGVTVSGGPLRGIEVDMSDMPDMVPTLAITAAYAQGTTIIANVAHLRLKESDRLQTVAEGLQRMKIQVEEGEDGLLIRGGKPQGAMIAAHDDHRIAMSFAVAGLGTEGVRIDDESCVEKSFPQFWETLEQLYS
ncbi:MAG: 3-phosphoshikimate 1-carboxyvinyltransferase [Deltaproteobacteria bacterium]|nr:MAG: 3-phosphoshikimate 1-carboxyvinyltransferase [Deltaproteobacteria bacterium]